MNDFKVGIELKQNNNDFRYPKKLRKKLKAGLIKIRRAYSSALKDSTVSVIGEWLCDNYYIFEREGRAILKELRNSEELRCDRSKIPLVYNECVNICLGGDLPCGEELVKMLKDKHLNSAELEKLPIMIRAALLDCAAEACMGTDEKSAYILSSSIKSMRNIQDIDFDLLFEEISETEQILKTDPTGIYSKMDDATRSYYRKVVSKRAKHERKNETEFAKEIAEKAKKTGKHIGEYLKTDDSHKKRGNTFLVIEAVLPLAFAIGIAILLKAWYVAPLLYFPLWEVLRPLIEALSLKGVTPSFIPRMDFRGEIPQNAPTLITVSTLLPSGAGVDKMARKMEQLWRTNSKGAVKICILADLKSAKTPTKPEDDTDIAAMQRVIEKLNKKHNDAFIFAIRPRSYSQSEREYTGSERKRGAITQLVRLMKGRKSEIVCIEGNEEFLKTIKYIMALDSDTSLSMESVSEIVAAAEHPFNKAEIDGEKGVVKKGYGIFAPRAETNLRSACATAFSKIMAGGGGITAYDNFSSDRYQDLFGEGIFSGKGLINTDVFSVLLDDIFCPESVLSHDILEGSFLRTMFVSDVQITDGFPKGQIAYSDRLHRWVRGDWQNIRFLFDRVKTQKGRIKNPLNGCSRYKLFDNLRRSFTPVITALSILLSLLMTDEISTAVLIISLLSVCAGELMSMARSIIAGGPSMFSRRYYSGTMPVALACLTRAITSVIMLIQTAYICADAIFKALFRMFISKRHLLQWVTAADSEKSHQLNTMLRKCLPSLSAGAVLIVFGNAFQIICGIVFISNLIFAIFTAKEKEKYRSRFDYLTRDRLNSYVAAMWKYYEEFCTSANNYLPPDNVQETPVYRIAYRTSPTNIGLMLLCTLAARDFGFIDSEMLYKRLKQNFNSINKLEKWNGNLINWYDIKTLKALEPKYVSTVDSGNFICCLIALKQGIKEYTGECARLDEIIDNAQKIINESDISKLYNKRRKLFHIGYDISSEIFSNSYYDLLMSEARMTSYYAIANGDVTKKHWGMLGRTLAKAGRYTGPVSWTGTMFEYYMPHILLPAYDNTLSFEALKFCSWCQKKRVQGKYVPWGISESGFYAFDPQLNYQYKAHGVQKLGLKRGLNSDLVISPYSTFLALPFEPKSALENLKELEEMQMTGRCGFYEAADFTNERVDMQDYAVVRSYMAHHVGMSMLSVCNALKNNIMQKRFISDERMASATSLLEEKIPSGAVVFKDVELREVPQRAERVTPQTIEYDEINPLTPHMQILTNGEWSAVVSDNGASASLYRGANITSTSSDLLRRPAGVFSFVKVNDMIVPITKAVDYTSKAEFRAEFSHTCIKLFGKNKSIEGCVSVTVHPRLPCEQRRFTIKNSRKQACRCTLNIYFEPSLTTCEKEMGHPAFSKLFITGKYDEVNNLYVFSRTAARGDHPLCLAVGFLEKVKFHMETSKEKVLTSPYGVKSVIDAQIDGFGETGTPDNCCAVSVPLKIQQKGQATLTFIMCAASTKDEAIERALKAREDGIISENDGAPSPFNESGLDGVIAASVLPRIFFHGKLDTKEKEAVKKNELSKDTIWKFGISGDNPIILVHIHNEEDMMRAVPYIRLNRKLYRSGILTDVAIAFSEGGEYSMPVRSALRKVLRKEGCAQCLDTDSGVHAVDLSLFENSDYNALVAACSYIAPVSGERFELPQRPYIPMQISECSGAESGAEKVLCVQDGYFSNNCFVTENKTVNSPWCHVLANSMFGTLLSDKALGYTWAINSRENKLTPWFNDASTDNRGELLLIKIDGEVFDMLLGSTAEFYGDRAEYYGKTKDVAYKITISVPERGMMKNIDVEMHNTSDDEKDTEIVYYTEPVLGVDRKNSRFIKSEFDGKNLILTSPWNGAVKGFMAIGESERTDFFTCDREGFLQGDWYNSSTESSEEPCALVGKRIKLPARRSENVKFVLSFAANKPALYKIERIKVKNTRKPFYINIDTPDKALNSFVNTLLLPQILNSRIFGRTGFYQCGGAFGYRDQLQDVLSVIPVNKDIAKRQIIRAAACQFEQGDVLHWWHRLPKESGGLRGVRTRYSDDMLWLVFAVCEYVQKTGDYGFLDIPVPFLIGDELYDDEIERYFQPKVTAYKETIFEHCRRAVERSLSFGEHRLPLMQGGDWNDGYNTVGIEGKGESVWLAQFLIMVLEKTADVCKKKENTELQERYSEIAKVLRESIDKYAWDGQWYLRAFYDDGTPMGTHEAKECTIDSLTQSFSVFSSMPDAERRNRALDSALKYLADEKNGIVKLFTPPFSKIKSAGYVSSYPKGIRENGGQYTHAAVWLASALLKEGRAEEGYMILKMLNPAEKYEKGQGKVYGREPYALAGDVSSADGIEGRGGWSLYTGAAGWYYSTVYEDLLGIKLSDGKIFMNPHLPESWKSYSVKIVTENSEIEIHAKKSDGVAKLIVDGREQEYIPLDEKNHSASYFF